MASYDSNELANAILARIRSSRPPVTYAQIANGHVPQLELMERASEPGIGQGFAFLHTNVIALCSHRAAKSTSIMALMAMDAAEFDGVQLYFGKTKPAVRLSIWSKVWKPLIKKYFHRKDQFEVQHNETMMTSTFPNGAIVAFTGTDDKAHVESYLGNKLRRSVIDEAQSQPPSVLKPLIDEIFPPALSDVGAQLIVAGTIPETPAGTFYELWQTGEGWLKRNWSRFDNPHLGTVEEQMVKLQKYLQTSKHKITDSIVRRDWFGEFVFDLNATAYAYEVNRNGYNAREPEWLEKFLRQYDGDPYFAHIHRTIEPNDGKARNGIMAAIPWEGIEVYSCAIDPGAAADRFSVQVNGWGSGVDKIQHVFEFSSERKVSLRWSQIDPIRRLIQEIFGPSWWYYDAGGSKVVLDTFVGDTGLPALMPAAKSGLKHQVDRVSDLLLRGWLQVMKGSALEEDYQKAKWNQDARARLQWRWDSSWHPDASESQRYSLAPYIEVFEEKEEEKSQEEQDRERHESVMKLRMASKMGHIPDEVMDAAIAEDETEALWD